MNIYWNSFRTFFRIGLFTIGGGYAMIPLIEADVVDKNKWVAREDSLFDNYLVELLFSLLNQQFPFFKQFFCYVQLRIGHLFAVE